MTTPDTPLLDDALGTLARTIPGATALFHTHQLDFCCGGKKSLRTAAAERSLDTAPVRAGPQAPHGAPPAAGPGRQQAPPAELIEHLLTRFHARHREQLPELIRLSRRVETVHADRPECPTGLADHLTTMAEALESHMQKEEQILFPMLLRGFSPMVRMPIGVMRLEHDDHGVALARLVALAHGLEMPRGACNTWRALVLGLRTLREDLMEHIHLENNLLFDGLNHAQHSAESVG
ncbi:iron-sulfur cluster repair protein YtfE [Sphaerotilus montanus]|uniref:iron-sulfur cluster repair protein YtfE n=1 Tax=Sphaerotilus montanus TaxID=522889 RepID=UPI003FA3348F